MGLGGTGVGGTPGVGGMSGVGGTPGVGGATGAGGSGSPIGTPCGPGTTIVCQTGFCVDGVCCDGSCTGQCEACDVNPGHCSPVANGQQPHGAARGACTGMGDCQARCDGISNQCPAPPNGTACVCLNLVGGLCNGQGHCATLLGLTCDI
jgi:hypothetical protein